jgi:hypothetical protein
MGFFRYFLRRSAYNMIWYGGRQQRQRKMQLDYIAPPSLTVEQATPGTHVIWVRKDGYPVDAVVVKLAVVECVFVWQSSMEAQQSDG